jgi:hypothetical protein
MIGNAPNAYPLRLPHSVKAEVERRDKADLTAFDRIMRRNGGESRKPEDTV